MERILVPVLILLVLLSIGAALFLRHRRKTGAGPLPRPKAGGGKKKPPQPDCPQSFGSKNGWLCICCRDPGAVIRALGGEDVSPSSWSDGLARAGEGGWVFVSPCLDGFVLAVLGIAELDPAALGTIAEKFIDVQYFCTHDTTEYHCWARYWNGKLERGYTYVGDEDKVLWDEGEMTMEELTMDGTYFPCKGEPSDKYTVFPREETVVRLAAAWGIDPTFSNRPYPPSLGWLCRLPGHGDTRGSAET